MRTSDTTGLADPILDAQGVFRAIMAAMAEPGTIRGLPRPPRAPAGLPPGLAALALTLADFEAAVWLDAAMAADEEVASYLRFHTGAAIVPDPSAAAFALVSAARHLPPLERFAPGTLEYPDRSTTVVVAVDRLVADVGLTLSGPGVPGVRRLGIDPLPAGLVEALAVNAARFPLGVDTVLVAGASIAALPRTTRIEG